jgi:uncharacterized protein YkwD
MVRRFLPAGKLIVLFLLLTVEAVAQKSFEEWTNAFYEEARTATEAGYMNEEEKMVVYYCNLVRLNPSLFADTYLKAYLDTARPFREKWVRSLQKDLKSAGHAPVLLPAEDLAKEARSHANDMGRTGKTGHNSSSGKNFKSRMQKFRDVYTSVGENCDYVNGKALNIVMSLLIDEGVESLGHRKNILNKEYRYIGVAIAPHKKYGYNCVMDFGGEKK